MKFAALVLLLAVGSQAASLQADAPDQIAQFRAKLKEGAIRVLAPLDGTTYKANKDHAIEVADSRLGQAIEMGQTAFSAASDATAGIRGTIVSDIQKLQADLADQAEKVRENVLKHVQDYIAALTPLKEHLESKKADIEELKAKVTSVVENIGEKVPTNWEETRGSLMPIVQKVKDQLTVRGQEARAQIEPYVKEYMETAQGYIENPGDKAAPALEELKTKLSTYFAAMVESLNKA
ncbi:apolipoprotein A-Ib [Amphiprion ocellaris]|uniref:Apolipoprotein A-I n=1 Tax=Amphiprion percula TaxID=161767 RepID=A0A3P8U9K6_AMPPE|nr:apolipoprotein A-Ib [Amphiprion ocellaris]